jgi:hypothetical protein
MKKSPSANGGQGLKSCASSNKTDIYSSALSTANTNSRRPTKSRPAPKVCRREVAAVATTATAVATTATTVATTGTAGISATGKATACNSAGQRVGTFSSLQAATDALDAGVRL